MSENMINNLEQRTMTKLVTNQNKRYNQPNIKRLSKTPIFCVYYQQIADSTASSGFKQIKEKLGPESPLRFTRIDDVPLFAFSEFNREARITEYKGRKIDLNMESLILPEIVATKGDYLIIRFRTSDATERILLFEVDSASPNTVFDEPHFRLSYTMRAAYGRIDELGNSNDDLFVSLEQQTVRHTKFIMRNAGTNKASFLDIDTVGNIKRLTFAFKRINDMYKECFYDDENNLLTCDYMCTDNEKDFPEGLLIKYYSPILVEFQRRCQPIMYEYTENYSGDLILTQESMEKTFYEKSLYHDLELQNQIFVNYEEYGRDRIQTKLYFDTEKFKEGGDYLKFQKLFWKHRHLSSVNQYIKEKIFVMNFGLSRDKPQSEIDEITKVLDHNSDIVKVITLAYNRVLEVIDIIEDFEVYISLENFMYVPILLYILKQTIIDMQKNPTKILRDTPGWKY